jgi:hypothetical protein
MILMKISRITFKVLNFVFIIFIVFTPFCFATLRLNVISNVEKHIFPPDFLIKNIGGRFVFGLIR